ncbi:site-2 protease family protein [Thermomonospora umbrina]|uniref:Zinc metalloprotease n=1 Tax=Thermomonospora umbrina TaxID=111806 RepID=A0A3D9SYS2_9ACTN|nr:site-2 protease family protein [Thermomonospora umbrina]REF00989.1 Zn-dependent protease [Thermomonospora umbrina]
MADSAPPAGQDPQEDARSRGLRVGRPFGIPVYVSPSWFLVALLITVLFEGQVRDVASPPWSHLVAFAYAVLLYGSVFVHELSHAVTARMFGLPVRSVTLHILGGETAIERESPTPGQEFLIAFAGPLVNLVLAGFGLFAQLVLPLPPVGDLLVAALTFANLLVGVFNLLPGLPLDGGRLVRAAVWKVTGRGGAGTVVAAWVGRGVAVLTLAGGAFAATYPAGDGIGWLSLVWSALVASFIWVGATQSLRAEKVRARIPGLQARRLARRAALVTADLPLSEAVRRAQEQAAGALVVVDHDHRPVGLVSEGAVRAVPEHRRPWLGIGEVSRSLAPELTLPADLSGEALIDAIRRAPATEYLLVEPDGRVYGVLVSVDVDRVFAGV